MVLALAVLTGCSYGPNGGRVGETGQVQVLSASALPAPGAAEVLDQARSYVIGPQDVLIVDVFGIEELTDREITVDVSGRIALPLTGTLDAAGNSPEQLANLIESRLRDSFVRNPQVSVNVKNAVSQVVTVDGQVAMPGVYPVLGNMTLTRAIASAQGLAEFAKQDEVVVLRTVGGARYAGVYNIAAIRKGNYADPQIFANDTVIVGDSTTLRRLKDFIAVLPAITSPLIYILDGNN